MLFRSVTIPSKGFYVAEVNLDVAREEQLNKIENLLDTVVTLAKTNNIEKKTIIEILDILYEEEK